MPSVVLVGASGHGRVVADVVEKHGDFEIAGFVDADPAVTEGFGYPVLGTDEILPELIKTVHPSAVLARGVTIGEGSVVMAGAVLNSNAALGRHCIVNTRASLDHDSRMEDFSSLGPNAVTGGRVAIGEYSGTCPAGSSRLALPPRSFVSGSRGQMSPGRPAAC